MPGIVVSRSSLFEWISFFLHNIFLVVIISRGQNARSGIRVSLYTFITFIPILIPIFHSKIPYSKRFHLIILKFDSAKRGVDPSATELLKHNRKKTLHKIEHIRGGLPVGGTLKTNQSHIAKVTRALASNARAFTHPVPFNVFCSAYLLDRFQSAKQTILDPVEGTNEKTLPKCNNGPKWNKHWAQM